MFFAGSKEYPAAGLFSAGHLLMIIVCGLLLTLLIRLTILKKLEKSIRIIQIVSIIVLVLEIGKIIWGTSVGRYSDWYDYLPLWFCSLFIPISLIAGYGKGKIQYIALTFLFYGGIVGGLTYLVFPTTSIGRYPVFHFITFHSMFYHVLMIYIGFFVIYYQFIKPGMKDLKWYLIITTVFCIISYITNYYLDTNYMFLSSYSNNPVLKILYEATGRFYPLVLTIGQNVGTFMVSLAGYKLIENIKNKKILVKKSI